jgi:hypothetical protein
MRAAKKGGIPNKRSLKNFLKEIFKKYLTSEGTCGIIVKLSARAGSEKVIEN